jgi:hypothetical protein
MNDMYQMIQLAGAEEDGAEILGALAAIKAGKLKNDLKLLNYFREIPVSYGATIETVEESHVELAVHQIQAVVISFEKMTVLKSSHFPKDVIANVNYVNIEKSRLVLSGFSYAIVRADRRMSVRVELSEPIYASFSASGQTATGRLHDMSLTGVSINVSEDPGIPLSQNGELTVTLPIGNITVPASLLKISTLDDGYRLAFEIEATRATELSISKYILQRQVEIIRELKDHPSVTSG